MSVLTAEIQCPQGHGPMVRRGFASGTPEQRWGGVWFDCLEGPPSCRTVVLVPSAELVEQLRQVQPPCVDCGLAVADWDVEDPLHRVGSHQCPGCIRRDIDEDRRQSRRDDL